MKRRPLIVFALCIALAAGLAACNDNTPSAKVAVVDANKVFEKSGLAQEGMAYVQEIETKFTARIAEMQELVAANPENQEILQAFQVELMELERIYSERQMEVGDKLNKIFEEVLDEYIKAHGLDVILPAQSVMRNSPKLT